MIQTTSWFRGFELNVHLFFLLILVIGWVSTLKQHKLRKNILIFVVFFALFWFSALRYGFGNDYFSYETIFTNIKNGGQQGYEVGYVYLNLLMPNFKVLVFALSGLYIVFLYFLLIRDNQKSFFLGLIVLLLNPYLFLLHLSAIRQTIALIIFFFSTKYIINRKILPYCILILIAFLFHKSAILLLPVYFIVTPRKYSKITLVFIVLLVVVFSTSSYFIDILRFLVIKINPRYSTYLNSGSSLSLRTMITTSYLLVLIFIFWDKFNGRELIFAKLYLLFVLTTFMGFQVLMIGRYSLYFEIFAVILIPIMFSKFEDKKMAFFIIIPQIILYMIRYYNFFTSDVYGPYYNDYRTIFSTSKPFIDIILLWNFN